MKFVNLRILAVALSAIALFTLSGHEQFIPATVHAQSNSEASMPTRTLTVVGNGVVNITPDTAHVTIGVDVVKPTVAEAYAANQQGFETLFAALNAAGIADKDIQTSGFNIYMEQLGDPTSADAKTQYHVTNNVDITIRKIDTVGSVLDAMVTAGANSINGISFGVDDSSAAASQARAAAVENAQAKAAELAKLNGVKLGAVLTISEVGDNGFAPQPTYAYDAKGGGPTIAAGELQISQQVQITYQIGQ